MRLRAYDRPLLGRAPHDRRIQVAHHVVREGTEDVAFDKVELPVLAVAETRRLVDELVEHRLQALAARHGAQDAAKGALLLAEVAYGGGA